jgi:hypothetical protein
MPAMSRPNGFTGGLTLLLCMSWLTCLRKLRSAAANMPNPITKSRKRLARAELPGPDGVTT